MFVIVCGCVCLGGGDVRAACCFSSLSPKGTIEPSAHGK
jgi:hypothetical protein